MGRKLVVEICNAKNLMPKDGQGTASAYVIADFDGQRRRTKTQFRDLNPKWDEKLEFSVIDPDSDTLELNIYNDNTTNGSSNKKFTSGGKRSTFLGRVKVAVSAFYSASDSDDLVYYPLEKRSVFSQVKGEIGVRVFFLDEQVNEKKKEEEKEEEEAAALKEEPSKAAEEVVDEKKAEEAPSLAQTDSPVVEVVTTPPEQVAGVNKAAEATKEKEDKKKEEVVEEKKISEVVALELRSSAAAESERGGGGGVGRHSSACDLVDRMPFLFVRVVKSKFNANAGESSAFAKLVIGTHTVRTATRLHGKKSNEADWDQVFAFDKESLNSTSLEVSVWDGAEENKEELCLGTVSFDLGEVPRRVPPDTPLAPQWYTLEPNNNNNNDVMLSVWFGTQADEAFQEAWQSDSGGLIPETRAKVYLSPKLWYLRLTVIQTQDLQLGSGSGSSEIYVKAQLGGQVFKTSRAAAASGVWNEDLMFVAAEPFEPFLVVSVEDVGRNEAIGHVKLDVPRVEKRVDEKTEPKSKWFNLSGTGESSYSGRIHIRACLEGGYHVQDEAAHVTSDVRAAAKQLSKPPLGVLEVGIRGAANLLPVKTKDGTRGTVDAYVVVKYGRKWVRTRTILDRFSPRWNEHYTWDVYDPCTVLTIGVFDNNRYGDDKNSKDLRLGKVRIRVSTLDTNRVYSCSYPLLVLLPNGAKKMGEVEIAVRFSCQSWLNLIHSYSVPILPRMHYLRPLAAAQQDVLRHAAARIVTSRLARSEPALPNEVVHYLLDSDSHHWSMRRSKAGWMRAAACLSRLAAVVRGVDEVRTWANPAATAAAHAGFAAAVALPEMILPVVFACVFVAVAMRVRLRLSVRTPPAAVVFPQAEAVGADELDEEFDGIPSSRSPDTVRLRYDRLRALAGRAQTLVGDMAAQGERVEALLSWRDPRATAIFAVFCLVASLVLYAVPFKLFVLASGFYFLRHPRFRDDMPSLPINFFRRLPSLSDHIM